MWQTFDSNPPRTTAEAILVFKISPPSPGFHSQFRLRRDLPVHHVVQVLFAAAAYSKAAVFSQREFTSRSPLGLTCSRPLPVPPEPFPRNIVCKGLAAHQSYEERFIVLSVSQRRRQP